MSLCSWLPRLELSWAMQLGGGAKWVRLSLERAEVMYGKRTWSSDCYLVLMIRWQFHLIRQAAQVHVPERRPEALCNSVLTPALSQPRSGEAPQAASGAVAPLVPRNSCSQCGLSVFSFQSAEAHVSWNAASQLPFLLPQPENSKCRLKTTIQQLCQHGRLRLENFFSSSP